MAVTDSKDSLKKQRERLSLELQHLEQTYKSGLLRLQEYTLAKKAMDKKISLLDQKQKQFEAKEKAVEEILGASSMLSSQASKDAILQEKQHHKYFMKIEKPLVSQKTETPSKYVPFKDLSKPILKKEFPEKITVVEKRTDAESKLLRKKEIADSITQDIKQKGFQEKKIQERKFTEKYFKQKEVKQKEQKKVEFKQELKEKHKEQNKSSETKKEKESSIPLSEHLPVSHQLPAASLSSPVLDPALSSSYQDIDELVEREDSNWRFALAILTLFLLILLYVKFTSFGGTTDVLTVDAYLDITSAYSKDMHGVLAQLVSEYGQSLWVTNHIIGSNPESILAGTAVACAGNQDHGTEYLDYLFSQNTVFATDADAIALATTLGLDSSVFSSCLADPAIKEQYLASQDEIAALDITYTPTLIINNKKIVGAVGYDVVKAAIDAEMTALG